MTFANAVRFALIFTSLLGWSASQAALEWPQEIDATEGTIVVYQPQPEGLNGNILSGRAATSFEPKGGGDLVFGAFWFDAMIDTDTDDGTAWIRSITVTKVRWPDSTDAGEQRFSEIIAATVPENGFEISMDQLSASLATADLEKKSLENLKNDPPVIIFSQQLALLLLFDGDPRFADIEGSDYERALNTPFAVARNKKTGVLYLSSGLLWYQARDPMGPWTTIEEPPADLRAMVPPTDEAVQDMSVAPPVIVTATKPTEVISTDGEPDWQSLTGGKLLYVKNTETPWIRDLEGNAMYVLLSGRWFRASSADGPWAFVRPDNLPPSFKDIPPASDIGGLRVSVAGTEEAEDAMLDAQIPQTAAIVRSEATLTVEYAGEPKFEAIPGTKVSYAVNTASQVLLIDNYYYAVDDGVWFGSASAAGPWLVEDSIPEDEIQKIPASSPVYNVTHVHVYESTPEIVYVGYTPGYLWSFPYYGVPVYGTGWYYPPYWGGGYYYPRTPTWGFHVGYNPWTGWNYGVSWTNGFFSFGVAWGGGYGGGYYPGRCCGGWYGGGYRGPININTGDINIGNNVNIGNRDKISNRVSNNANFDRTAAKNNLYKNPENRNRIADRTTAAAGLKEARPATNRANNVFADPNGNVARRTNNQWETRQNGQWKPDTSKVTPATRDAVQSRAPSAVQQYDQRQRNTNLDRSSLNRSHQARQTGQRRQASRPRSMNRGGGRRR